MEEFEKVNRGSYMKNKNVKYNINSFLATRNYDVEVLEYIPKIRQSLPKIKLKNLPQLNLQLELAS